MSKNRSGFVPVVLAIVLALVVLLIAHFINKGGYLDMDVKTSASVESEAADPQISTLQLQSDSDEVADIEKDLNDTNLNSLDEESSEVDSKLGQL